MKLRKSIKWTVAKAVKDGESVWVVIADAQGKQMSLWHETFKTEGDAIRRKNALEKSIKKVVKTDPWYDRSRLIKARTKQDADED